MIEEENRKIESVEMFSIKVLTHLGITSSSTINFEIIASFLTCRGRHYTENIYIPSVL